MPSRWGPRYNAGDEGRHAGCSRIDLQHSSTAPARSDHLDLRRSRATADHPLLHVVADGGRNGRLRRPLLASAHHVGADPGALVPAAPDQESSRAAVLVLHRGSIRRLDPGPDSDLHRAGWPVPRRAGAVGSGSALRRLLRSDCVVARGEAARELESVGGGEAEGVPRRGGDPVRLGTPHLLRGDPAGSRVRAPGALLPVPVALHDPGCLHPDAVVRGAAFVSRSELAARLRAHDRDGGLLGRARHRRVHVLPGSAAVDPGGNSVGLLLARSVLGFLVRRSRPRGSRAEVRGTATEGTCDPRSVGRFPDLLCSRGSADPLRGERARPPGSGIRRLAGDLRGRVRSGDGDGRPLLSTAPQYREPQIGDGPPGRDRGVAVGTTNGGRGSSGRGHRPRLQQRAADRERLL